MKRLARIFFAVMVAFWVAGTSTSQADHGFLLSNGVYTPLIYGSDTIASGINNSGQIVGSYTDNGTHGFLLFNGVYSSIDYPGATKTFAEGINNSGQIVGYYNDILRSHGFLLDNNSYVPINFPGAAQTFAYGINDFGEIVGYYSKDNHNSHGFLKTSAGYSSFDYPDSRTYAFGINNIGQLVGSFYRDYGNECGGFLKDNESFTAFYSSSMSSSKARDVNNFGQIVGSFKYYMTNSPYRGFLIKDGQTYTFSYKNGTRGMDTYPNGINDAGVIVGSYRSWTEAPLPPSILTLGSGLLCLMGWRRLKKN